MTLNRTHVGANDFSKIDARAHDLYRFKTGARDFQQKPCGGAMTVNRTLVGARDFQQIPRAHYSPQHLHRGPRLSTARR